MWPVVSGVRNRRCTSRASRQVGMSDACGYRGPNARLDQRGRRSCPGAEAVEHGQIELAEPRRVVEDVDLGDLPAPDREAHHRERLSFQYAEQPSGTVDKHREPEQPEAREALRAASHLLRAADLDRSACQHPTGVDSEDHLWIEDSDEPVEVTVTRSRGKRIDDSSFNF